MIHMRTWVFYLPCSFSCSRLFYDHDVVLSFYQLVFQTTSSHLSCNVAYKIISKLFADRLKTWFWNCVIENESVFIPDRQIIDNIIIVHASIRYSQSSKKSAWAILKLVMFV